MKNYKERGAELDRLSPDRINPSTPSQHNVSPCFAVVWSLNPVWLFATPWPQHARLPCPSLSPGVKDISSQWCYLAIPSSIARFSSHPQSFLTSGSFPMSQLLTSGGQSIGVSASASVLPMNVNDWFPLGWTGWISLLSKGLLRVFSTPQFKSINSSVLRFLYSKTLTSIYDCWKTIILTLHIFVGKMMSLVFNTQSS